MTTTTDARLADADDVLACLHAMVEQLDRAGICRDVQAAALMGWAAAQAINSIEGPLLAATLRRLADRIETGDPLPSAQGTA